MQTPQIRGETAKPKCLMTISALRNPIIGVPPIEIRSAAGMQLTVRRRHIRTRTARVFPFRFGRKSETVVGRDVSSLRLRQIPAKSPRFIPGNPFNRQPSPLTIGRIRQPQPPPLALREFVFSNHKRVRDRDPVLPLVFTPSNFIFRRPHREGSRLNPNKRDSAVMATIREKRPFISARPNAKTGNRQPIQPTPPPTPNDRLPSPAQDRIDSSFRYIPPSWPFIQRALILTRVQPSPVVPFAGKPLALLRAGSIHLACTIRPQKDAVPILTLRQDKSTPAGPDPRRSAHERRQY